MWMNPCENGCHVPWNHIPLVEEGIGDCMANTKENPYTPPPTAAPSAAPGANVTITGAGSNAVAAGLLDNTTDASYETEVDAEEPCKSCADRGNGFFVLGCGRCQDDAGAQPSHFVKQDMTPGACRSACEVDSNCYAYEVQEVEQKSCYLYFTAGTPEGDWVVQNGTSNRPVSKTSTDMGFEKGCNIRGRPSTCAADSSATIVDSAAEAAKQAETAVSATHTTCVKNAVKGNFTTLGCGFCEGPLGSAKPRRFTSDGMLPAQCRSACDQGNNCYAYEVSEGPEPSQQICYMYYESGSPGDGWVLENGESTVSVARTSDNTGNPTGCTVKTSHNISPPPPVSTADGTTGASSAVAQNSQSATQTSAEAALDAASNNPNSGEYAPAAGTANASVTPSPAPNATVKSQCVNGATRGGFYTVGCGRCRGDSGGIPRRYLQTGVSAADCQQTCEDKSECGAFEAEEVGDQTCYVYFETGSPGPDWVLENEDNVEAVGSTSGTGYPMGCLKKETSTVLELMDELE